MSRAYAISHGLPLKAADDVYSVGGVEHFDTTHFRSLQVGGIIQPGTVIFVTDLSNPSAQIDKPIDLVLGSSMLSLFALQVDFDHRRLRLLASGQRPLIGTDIPLSLQTVDHRITMWISVEKGPR